MCQVSGVRYQVREKKNFWKITVIYFWIFGLLIFFFQVIEGPTERKKMAGAKNAYNRAPDRRPKLCAGDSSWPIFYFVIILIFVWNVILSALWLNLGFTGKCKIVFCHNTATTSSSWHDEVNNCVLRKSNLFTRNKGQY